MRFEIITSEHEIREVIRLNNIYNPFIVLDTETTDKDPRKAKLLDVQISGLSDDIAYMFSAEHAHLLLDINIPIVAHNYKYDAHILYRHGVDLLDKTWRDTLLIGHLVDENRESYSLDSYVKEYWNDPYKEEFWAKYKTYEEAPKEEALIYACKDVYFTGALYRRFLVLGDKLGPNQSLIEHAHRLQASLLKTEIAGISVDQEYLLDLGVKLKTRINELQPKMQEIVKHEIDILEMEAWAEKISTYKTDKGRSGVPRPVFNFESATQLRKLLYGSLGLPEQRNEKTKAISTDYDSLERLKEHHPVVGMIQENRDLQKVSGTYIDGTLERMQNGRIYPSFRVGGTVTGRISHSNPNLGQLPRTGGIRGIYRPGPGHVFIAADYSQLEVCIEANVTRDEALARIFTEGLSKHDITSEKLGVDRSAAKTLNFCLQYWGTHYKVAKLLKVPEHEAKKIVDDYWALYKGPKALKAETDKAVDAGEPLVSLFGRRRRFLHKRRSPWDGDYRQAYNFLIQSLGADLTSKAFYLISDWLEKEGIGRGLFTVHDEILIEVESSEAARAEVKLLEIMVQVGNDLGLKIPLKAESSGPMYRWED